MDFNISFNFFVSIFYFSSTWLIILFYNFTSFLSLFFIERKHRKDKIQFSSRSFFLHLILPMTSRLKPALTAEPLVTCETHLSGVIAVGKSEVVGSNPTVGPNFYIIPDTRLHIPAFYITKKHDFSNKT